MYYLKYNSRIIDEFNGNNGICINEFSMMGILIVLLKELQDDVMIY